MIFNENCLDTMKRLDDKSVDMILTSPPYDNLKKYDGYSFDFNSIAPELYRILKNDGVMVWIVGDATIKGSETGTSFRQVLRFMDLGFKLHDTMIYEKNSSTFAAHHDGNRYTQIFEFMFVLAKGQVKANLIKDKRNKWAGAKDWSGKMKNPVREFAPRTNIWKYVTSFNGWKHPAPFPEALAYDHIRTWSQESDLIYDPFIGSGTTAAMAIKLNRRYIGSEISSNYCALIEQRLAALDEEIAL